MMREEIWRRLFITVSVGVLIGFIMQSPIAAMSAMMGSAMYWLIWK